MDKMQNNSIFWIEVEKIKPNPYQPRREFDEERLKDLSESIRQYGILQPLTVSRIEMVRPDGGLAVEYELIAGERRLRASKLAGLSQVPCLIRVGDDSKAKLELAIIENLQREDLNPVDRAKSFQRLSDEFGLKHTEIGKKLSKSREYVSNTMRLLTLPQDMLTALEQGKISEGHTRPLLMLSDRPDDQNNLFAEMMVRKMTVREAEGIARRIAFDKVRKKEKFHDPDIVDMEGRLAESLGTRVQIEKREVGGKITIDFFSYEELQNILKRLEEEKNAHKNAFVSTPSVPVAPAQPTQALAQTVEPRISESVQNQIAYGATNMSQTITESPIMDQEKNSSIDTSSIPEVTPQIAPIMDWFSNPITLEDKPSEVKEGDFLDDRGKEEVKKEMNDQDDLYNVNNFTL